MNNQNFINLPGEYFQEPLVTNKCKACKNYVFVTAKNQDKDYCEQCRKNIRDLTILANQDIYLANILMEDEQLQEQLEKDLEINMEKVQNRLQMRLLKKEIEETRIKREILRYNLHAAQMQRGLE